MQAVFRFQFLQHYKYILNDCNPSLIFVSNQDQFNKIKNFVNSEVKKIISFEKIDTKSLLIHEIFNNDIEEKIVNRDLKSHACVYNICIWNLKVLF